VKSEACALARGQYRTFPPGYFHLLRRTALLFRLEHNRGFADVQKLIQTVYNYTEEPQYRELRRAFVSWM